MCEFVSKHQFSAAVVIYWIFSARSRPCPILRQSAVRAICGSIVSCTASPGMSQRRSSTLRHIAAGVRPDATKDRLCRDKDDNIVAS